MFLAFSDLRAPDFFPENGKDIFLLVFCPQSIRAGGGTMRTKFWQNYFLGIGFRKTETNLFLILSARRKIRYEEKSSISVDCFVLQHHPDNVHHLPAEADECLALALAL